MGFTYNFPSFSLMVFVAPTGPIFYWYPISCPNFPFIGSAILIFHLMQNIFLNGFIPCPIGDNTSSASPSSLLIYELIHKVYMLFWFSPGKNGLHPEHLQQDLSNTPQHSMNMQHSHSVFILIENHTHRKSENSIGICPLSIRLFLLVYGLS